MGSLKQINIRVSERTAAALAAKVLLDELRSSQDVLGPMAEELGQRLLADPDVSDMVDLIIRRWKKEGSANSKVTQLHPKPAKGKS